MTNVSTEAARLLGRLPCGVPTRSGLKAKQELLEAGLARVGTALGVPTLMLTEKGAAIRANMEGR